MTDEDASRSLPPQPVAGVNAFSAGWPEGAAGRFPPGDLSVYVPDGMGFGFAPVVRPWDNIDDAMARPGYYGFEARGPDPIRGAPTQDADGGVIYFDRRHEWPTVEAGLTLMGVWLLDHDFAVVQSTSANPVEDRYLDQFRIITKSAFLGLFGLDAGRFPTTQPVTIGEYLRALIEAQVERWHTPGHPFSPNIYGTFGGDGDFAKESLCFGFLVENSYWGVYRLWSRAELVTK